MTQYLDYNIKGRTAIVTGAGTGIGQASAIELAKAGAKVALFGRRIEKLEETKAEALKYTGDVLAISVDVSDRSSVLAAVSKVADAFGGAEILVNNAGIESPLEPGQSFQDLFDDQTPDEYLEFFKIHALGHFNMNEAVLPYMKEKKYGRIVNITSVTGMNGVYSTSAYTASKGAAITQTKAFAPRIAPYNITINSIAPGMVDTPMKIGASKEEFEFVANITPLGRVAQPVDIARVVMFFAQENLFVTGQNLVVDGGSSIF
ncbi:MAG: SDR family oxidoreductase [Clostridiales Family XIII bacterium]|jgi:3-oxoacyl-[acyl-carrier protein] reductase|nr:SDR family oxidoreductase [Clostridiales Family XIII bacterium]